MNNNKKAIVQLSLLSVVLFGLALLCWFAPSKAQSDSERRELAQFPTFSLKTLLSGDFMDDFENYTLDQFPMRDKWRTLKSVSAFYLLGQLDSNDIYITNGYACQLEYPLNSDSIDFASKKFEWIYDQLISDSDASVYLSVIPDKNYFLAEENGYLSLDYAKLTEQLRASTDSFSSYIDLFPLLELEDYYHTDTHWRQECIVDVAEKLCGAMGVSCSDVYSPHTLDTPFYGVYYGQAALPLEPDTITWLTSDVLDNCTVYDHQNGQEMSIYDMEKAYGRDAYEMYLSGSLSLITIENPLCENDRELVIFRDSFGSSIAPLMLSGYSKITLVDIRYLPSMTLSSHLTFANQDVLFLYSTLVLNNSSTLK